MFRKLTKATIAASCVLALAACSSTDDTVDNTDPQETTTPSETAPEVTTPTDVTDPTEIITSEIVIADAWARSVPGEDGMNKGAIYATITSPVDDAILSASIEPAAAASKVEVHEVIMGDNGEMKMQMVERVDLKAGVATELKPGSYHIMLMGMPEVLPVGTEISVTINFEKAGPVNFTAVVREDTMPAMGNGMSEESGSMMGGDSTEDANG